jgi:LAO/AO transport system kinase
MSVGRELGERLAARDVTAAAAVLNLVESRSEDARHETAALLAAVAPAALAGEAPGQIVGVTGPPGAGKSSLLSRMLAHWRAADRSVAVLAVDPSSRRSGGSLLGDRARIERDSGDERVFIRSTATGDRLGGLAPATRAAATALAAAFDLVVIETVGVGQSETEIADVADEVAVVVQPGSGDVLQFLKSGIMEIPDVLVVTKSDLGTVAERALADLRVALQSLDAGSTPVVAVSSMSPPAGIGQLIDALDERHRKLDLAAHRGEGRRAAALSEFAAEHGDRGLRALGGRRSARTWLQMLPPELDTAALVRALEARAEGT